MEKTSVDTASKTAPVPASHKNNFFSAGGGEGASPPFFQPKLLINPPNDVYEKQADAIAQHVVENSPGVLPSRQSSSNEATDPQSLQLMSDDPLRNSPPVSSVGFSAGSTGSEAPGDETASQKTSSINKLSDASADSALLQLQETGHGTTSSGEPLENNVQASMSRDLGADLSPVRIHTNTNAVQLSEALHAKAFTIGSDIFFNKNQYAPSTSEGKKLLAHELVHTIQQKESNGVIQRQPTTLSEITIVGDPQFYQRALRSNRYYQQHIHTPGWPYLTPMRALWTAGRYDDFADAVRDYQEQVMHLDHGDGILGPDTAAAMTVPGAASPQGAPVAPTAITLEALRQNPDWIERRVLGVGIFGWGGPFRLDLELNAQGYPTRSIFLPRNMVSLAGDPIARHLEFQLGNRVYDNLQAATQAVHDFPFARPDATVYAFYRGEENIIFPTIISESTTPNLMRVFRLAIRQEGDDAAAASNLVVQSFLLAAGLRFPMTAGRSAASETAVAGTAATETVSAATTLRNFFQGLLRSGGAESITVEGVQFGNVRVATEAGNVLRVIRTSILNVERTPGQGRVMAQAFEEAAVQLGRQTGATSVRVSVETVVNARWLQQLQEMGYEMEQIVRYSETGAFQSLSNVWTKVFTL